jgi:hypothetical protein
LNIKLGVVRVSPSELVYLEGDVDMDGWMDGWMGDGGRGIGCGRG